MPHFTIYSRRGCHLCELLVEDLLAIVGQRATVDIRDVDSRPDWLQKYNARVPVVEYRDEVVCEGRMDRDAVRRRLDSTPEALQHEAK
ncbi:MAG: glutaredoxin family protein [Woeseiaceae bacterium]|nr:glutaredoxin family protein [Woeseiaceae bacterium]